VTCAPLALPSPSAPVPDGKIRFSGIVRGAETCAAVAQVQVGAYEAHSGALTITTLDVATTDASGLFTLTVPTGVYRILFVAPAGSGLASRWWVHELSYVRATSLDGDRAGLDMLLPHGFTISGNVITDTGAPLQAGILVSPATDYFDYVTSAFSGPDGHYTVTVATGDYRLHFLVAPPWASQWWNKRSSHDAAEDVIVAKDVTDVSVMVHTGRVVSGRVTLSSKPTERVLAFATLPSTRMCCEFVGNAFTRADGTFRMALPDGTYRIGFAFTDRNGHLFANWWPDGSLDMAKAGPVLVDRDRTDIDYDVP
jgi:hypothetical protein